MSTLQEKPTANRKYKHGVPDAVFGEETFVIALQCGHGETL